MQNNLMSQDKALWLVKGIGGILLVGFGLCVFGEGLVRKIAADISWVPIGGVGLAIFNLGLCLMFDSHNHQLRSRMRRVRSPQVDTRHSS